MRSSNRVLLSLALVGVLGLIAADAFGAGCASDSKEKKQMEKMMKDAGKLTEKGKSLEACKQYKEAAGMGACPILKKQCEKEIVDLEKEALEKLKAAEDLAKNKEAEQEDVTEVYCECFKLQFAWPRHYVAAQASKRLKKLKRKLSKETKKEGEKEAKAIVKDARAFIREQNYRSALAAYERLYDRYAFTKEARKGTGVYLKLQQTVEEENRREAEERKANR